MRVSVIICTLSRPQSVARLLESISGQSRLPDEIIIVDSSEDSGTETVVKNFNRVLKGRILYYRTERGLTRQRNFGIERADGDIIGFFDDDVVLDNNYLQEIERIFEQDTDEKIGGATGYIYPRDRQMSFLHRMYDHIRSEVVGYKYLFRYFNLTPIPKEPFTGTIVIRHVSGCNMFFRRQVFQSRKFDLWFEGYGLGEDMDFGIRVSRDWDIVAVGMARLHHLHELAGRPNYRKLGKMTIENYLRLLTQARQDYIFYYAFKIMCHEIIGVFIHTGGFITMGRFADAYNYMHGVFAGMVSGLKYVFGYAKNKKLVR